MPLNPDEVVNKRFSSNKKFRQGYDEEEVDEFLDEIVAELRRLNSENTDLRSKLGRCETRVAELSSDGAGARPGTTGTAGATGAAGTGTAGGTAGAKPVDAVRSASPATSVPSSAPSPAPTPAQTVPATVSGSESAAGMLALAQRLHDEHVEAGKNERDKIVGDAQTHATRLVRDAEDKQRQTLGALEEQRKVLEGKVQELRSFEREYRSRLRAYLESQLRELETTPKSAERASESPGDRQSTPQSSPPLGS